jgi:hypothetical protein
MKVVIIHILQKREFFESQVKLTFWYVLLGDTSDLNVYRHVVYHCSSVNFKSLFILFSVMLSAYGLHSVYESMI